MTFFDNFKSFQLIAAHRGYRSKRPENTLAAFRASIGHCHFIEIDIQMSKDFVPMVIHDPSLERTSNAKAKRCQFDLQSLNVCDWTLLQLKTLDVGSWFLDTDPFATISHKEVDPRRLMHELPQTIMTLEEVLLHPALRKTPVNIEIKDHKGKRQSKKVTETVVEVVRKTNSTNRVLISSFNHDYLVIVKTVAPTISTAALVARSHPVDLVGYLRSLGVAAYHPSDDMTDAELVRLLRSGGIGINVYTVNSRERQKELFAMGATAVFTDYPELPLGGLAG
jgi:glycerophosphoryl diester phosphodiesterase